jgi:tellurite resistance protein
MYGLGGSSGASNNVSASNNNAMNAPSGGREIMDSLAMQNMNAQNDLLKAQADNIKADTANKPIQGENIQANTANLMQTIEESKASVALKNSMKEINDIDLRMKEDTYEYKVDIVYEDMRIINAARRIAENDSKISDDTRDKTIKFLNMREADLQMGMDLKKADINLTNQQVKSSIENIKQGWSRLSIENRNAISNFISANASARNADTNVRQFLENVRNNDMNYSVNKGKLDLEKFVKDVSDSDKLTIQSLMDLLKIGASMSPKNISTNNFSTIESYRY